MAWISLRRCASIVRSLPDTNPKATPGMNRTDLLPPATPPLAKSASADEVTMLQPAILSTTPSVIASGFEKLK